MNTKPYIHPVHQCDDGIITSYSKTKIDLKNPKPDMFCLGDIARGLANTCRFAGQCEYYSVAQHSILVAMLAPAKLRPVALLHDASEAYIHDIAKPTKNLISGYAPIEEAFERAIFKKFKVYFELLKEIKPYDMQALQIEYEYIHNQSLSFERIFKGYKDDVYWSPKDAYGVISYNLEDCFG